MPCCVGFSRILLLLLSVVILFVGFTLACLVLWVRYDEKLEPELRQILLSTNTSVSVPELDEIKHTFRQAYLIIFWTLLAMASALILIGFFVICGACSQSRFINGFSCVLLAVLVILQIIVFLAIAFYRTELYNYLTNYLTTSFKYNLQDASVIQDRFACCGDGNAQASYNYQCTPLSQPNCQQILDKWFGMALAVTGISIIALVVLELVSVILFAVLICNRKQQDTDI